MSSTSENIRVKAAPSFGRRFGFPLVVLLVCALLQAAPWGLAAIDPETDAVMPLFMLSQVALLATTALLGAWWLFASGFSWRARLGVIFLLAVGFAGFAFSLRKVELTMGSMGLVPLFHFIWEPTAEEQLAEYLEKQPAKADDLPAIDSTIGPEDFPRFRGKEGNGVVAFAKLQADWRQQPPKLLWEHPSIGGYGGVAVAGNIAVTLEQRGLDEAVVCYDRATGRQRWVYAYEAFHKDVMGDGPRSTPTIQDGQIFTLGATGELVCLDDRGTKQWSINILADAKAKKIQWGMTGSPLIVDDLVVVQAGVDPDAPAGASLIAFHRETGKKRWAAGNRPAGYSSPQVATLGGKTQILLFAGDALVGCDLETGKELWDYPWVTKFDMNSMQPLVLDDGRVFISSEAENGCALLRVTAPADELSTWGVDVVWKNRNLASRFANPVTNGTHIFGLHGTEGVVTCLDVADGKRKWRGERFGPGQMLLTNDALIVVSGQGVVSLVAVDAEAFRELANFPVWNKKTWNTPALAGDQLILRNQAKIACLLLPRR